jgi:hypothetical protein
MPKENSIFFFISAIPGEPAPAGTDEPGQGEEGGDDVEDEHAKCHDEDGEVELVGDASTLKVHAVHITVHCLNMKKIAVLQTIFHICIPKKDLAKPHFEYQLNISKTELLCFVWNYDILEKSTVLQMQPFSCQ